MWESQVPQSQIPRVERFKKRLVRSPNRPPGGGTQTVPKSIGLWLEIAKPK